MSSFKSHMSEKIQEKKNCLEFVEEWNESFQEKIISWEMLMAVKGAESVQSLSLRWLQGIRMTPGHVYVT